VLGLAESALEDSTSLTRLGLDSLMATELRNRLLADTGFSPPMAHLLEGPSTTDLAALLESFMDGAAAAVSPHPQKPAPDGGVAAATEAARILGDLDHLSDQDVDRLLKEMLQEKEIHS
jgi:acyl carrier protein